MKYSSWAVLAMFSINTLMDSFGYVFSKLMLCIKLTFLKFCAGLKFEGRMSFEVSGLVKLPFSAQSAVHAKERTADAIANDLILKN